MAKKREPVLTWAVLAAVAALLLLVPAAYMMWSPGGGLPERQRAISGAFALVDHRGQPATHQSYAGKPFVVVFGFTHCPDICPDTLVRMADWIDGLGSDAEKATFAFVSLDPARDTPQRMAEYVTAFSDRIVGLTGDEAQVEAATKGFRVYRRKVPGEGGDYTFDHSTLTYLMDSNGRFKTAIGYNETQDAAIAKLRQLIDED